MKENTEFSPWFLIKNVPAADLDGDLFDEEV